MPVAQDQPKGTRVDDQQQQTQRALYNGFGNTLARAFELVVTPTLFALIGHLIDRWLGTRFVFAVAFGIFCVVGMSIRMFYGYIEQMNEHEANAVWHRQSNVTNRAAR